MRSVWRSPAIVNMRAVCATLISPGSQGQWTGMRVCEQWWLHCASHWAVDAVEWACVLCGHCIQNDWVSIALNLNVPPWKLFRWFTRPQPWATGDRQLHNDDAPAHASCLVQGFLEKDQITQVAQSLYSPDLVPCNFWLFPKVKSPLKGKKFQTIGEIPENTTEQLMVTRRIVRGPKVSTLNPFKVRGLMQHCPMLFLAYCIFFNKCILFIMHGWTLSGQAPLSVCV